MKNNRQSFTDITNENNFLTVHFQLPPYRTGESHAEILVVWKLLFFSYQISTFEWHICIKTNVKICSQFILTGQMINFSFQFDIPPPPFFFVFAHSKKYKKLKDTFSIQCGNKCTMYRAMINHEMDLVSNWYLQLDEKIL